MNLNFFPAALNKKKNSPLHSSVHQQDAHIKYHEKLQKRPPPPPICGPLQLARRERSRWHRVPWFLDPVSGGKSMKKKSFWCEVVKKYLAISWGKKIAMLQNSENRDPFTSCG